MKKIYTLIICIICFQLYATAQLPAINWSTSYGGSKLDAVNDVVETVDGGYLLVGYSYSNDGDVTGHHGSTTISDGWVVKINSSGVLQWQKSIGGDGSDFFAKVVNTLDNGFVCFGTTSSTNGDVIGNKGGSDAWAVKLDRFGNIIWSKCFGTAANEDANLSVKTQDGGFVFVGSSNTTVTNYTNNIVCKIDSIGNQLWQNRNDSFKVNYISEVNNNIKTVAFDVASTTKNFELELDKSSGAELAKNIITEMVGDITEIEKNADGYVFISNKNAVYNAGGLPDDCGGTPYNYNQGTFHLPLYSGSGSVTTTVYAKDTSYAYCSHACGQGDYGKFGNYTNLLKIDDNTFVYKDSYKYVNASSACIPPDYDMQISYGDNINFIGIRSGSLVNIYKQYYKGDRLKFLQKSKTFVSAFTYVNNIYLTVFKPRYVNIVQGKVFLDNNSNAIQDIGEPLFAGATVKTYDSLGSTNSFFSYNINGNYFNEVGRGKFVTKPVFTKKYYTVNPLSKYSIFNGDDGRDTVNFALQPIPNKNDLQINAFAVNAARPGFDIDYNIQYSNQGTTTLSGEVKFVKEHNLTYITANPLPSSIIGDTLIWNYTNLPMDSSATINVKFNIPNTFQFADIIHHTAIIYPIAGDETPYDNATTISQEVRGSFDPNDKNEIHNGKYTLTDLGNKEALLYTIRFQNTGNDTAFTVQVKDSLDNKLDINSFEMVSASHNYKLSIVDNKYCTWTFNNILLVDSNHNEAASHGYISYRIVPKSTVVHNDVINNSASIYFDFNLPVQTNVHNTTIINTALPIRLQSFTGKQNNKSVLLNWQAVNEINMDKYIVEKSVDGNKYDALGNVNANNKDNSAYQFTDEQPSKSVNYYRLKMVETNGKYSYSNIVSINYKNNSSITVYPNPTKDNVTIESKGIKKLVITDCFGRTVMQLNNITEHQTINTKQWNKGIYIVSFDNGEKVKVVKE